MPKIKFRTQGTSPASGRLNEPGGGMKQYPSAPSGDRTVTIVANRMTGTSPASFFFRAIPVGWNVSEPSKYLRFKWTFPSLAGKRWKSLRRTDFTPWGNDQEVAYLSDAARVFTDIGDHQVFCTVTDADGNQVTESITVTVVDQDVVYDGRTWVLSIDGDFTGAPPGEQMTTNRILDAMDAFKGSYGRVLLKRAEVGYRGPGIVSSWTGVCIDTWGPTDAPRPRINTDPVTGGGGIQFRSNSWNDVILANLIWEGNYDAAMATNGEGEAVYIENKFNAPLLAHNCIMRKNHTSLKGQRFGVDNENCAWHMDDVIISDYVDYGILIPNMKGALTGVRVEQNYDALGGGMGKSSYEPRHSPMRTPDNAGIYSPTNPWDGGSDEVDFREHGVLIYDGVELFSNSGWPLHNGTPNQQNNLRLNSTYHRLGRIRQSRCIGDSGDAMFGGGSNKSYEWTPPIDWVIDKTLYFLNNTASKSFGVARGGIVVQNFMIFSPKHFHIDQGYSEFFEMVTYNSNKNNDDNNNEAIRVFSGSIVEWLDTAETGSNDATMMNDATTVHQNYEIHNVVRYSPNLRTPITDDVNLEPLDLSPLYRGLYWDQQKPRDTMRASPAAVVGASVTQGTLICRSLHHPATDTSEIVEYVSQGLAGTIALNDKFTIDADGYLYRSGTGTLTAGTMEQVAIHHSYSDDREDYTEVISLRIDAGSEAQRTAMLPVPIGSLLTENPGGLHAIDYIDGTLRNGARIRGAIKPA